jgi:hypothetical protein
MRLNATVISQLLAGTAGTRKVDFIVFMEWYLTRIGKTLKHLAVSHAVPAGSRKVTVAFNFISERTVLYHYRIVSWLL